jgi:mannose-6-phosphate isomerase-like protein (cupin superfamily)
MEFVNINDIKDFQKSKVIKKIPIISKQLLSTLLFIDSNTSLPSHKHSKFDEIQYIISGAGAITMDGETEAIKEGMLILVPKTKPHNFSTLKDQMTILSVGILSENNQLDETGKNLQSSRK